MPSGLRSAAATHLWKNVFAFGRAAPADVVGAGPLEHGDALLHEVRRVVGVHVHAHDDLAAGAADALVEPGGLDARGVVDELDARVGGGEAPEDLARGVHAHPVGDQDLEPIARPFLRLDGLDARLDVRLFVETRDGDGHERRVIRLPPV